MGRFRAWLIPLLLLLVPSASAQTYEIGPGDVLGIAVRGQEAMSGEFVVDTAGMLEFPILGSIKAGGLTVDETQRKLTTLLADGYVRQPQVTVIVKEYQSQRVFVAGRVSRPGAYALPGDGSLLALVRGVGTLSDDVAHEVVVIRPPSAEEQAAAAARQGQESSDAETEGGATEEESQQTPEGPSAADEARAIWLSLPNEVPGSEIFRVNLTELLSGNPARNLRLRAGDTVYFPPAANFYVTGYAARPGAYRYREGLTVFHALTLAGGVGDRGSKNVKIIRFVDGEQVKINAEMTDRIQPEDTIEVPERFF